MSNEQAIEDTKKCDQRDIDYSQDEMGFKLIEVTSLLPESDYPMLVSERLESELRAGGDYNGQVWDLFFMGAGSPKRVRQTYNVYFTLVLNGREQTACVTQCGGSYTETYFVFALAGENIYYGFDVENPEIRALVEATS